MSIVLPAHFTLPVQLDQGRVALGQPITEDEITDLCERPHFIYGEGGRRALLERYWPRAVQTTSASYVTVMEAWVQLGTTRADVAFVAYGENADVKLEVEETDGTAIDEDTANLGASAEQETGAPGTLTPLPTVLLRVSIKVPSSGTATLEGIRVLESALSAADLP